MLKSAPLEKLQKEIESLLPYIDHRGPDAWGSYISQGIGLGHTRLSIIDPGNGHQPLNSENSVISYNGEVYNYLELRDELIQSGCVFRTNCDTEVVQQAIENWGTDAFKRFNGQFAILFWDKKKKELLIARDRFGIRPLYILKEKDTVYFSSELKVFDHFEERKRFWSGDNLLEHGLIWNTLGNKTIFRNITSLEGGYFQKFSKHKEYPPQSYYRLGENFNIQSEKELPFEEQVIQFREKLKESTKLRLRSDVPIGCYLSGGIDSSVTSLLAKEINKKSFKSFSVSFSDPLLDESEFQQDMVNSLGFDHYSVHITPDDVEQNFYSAAEHFERPVFRSAPVPLFLLSQKVRDTGVRVVLTGEAADEILFGYDTNKELKLLSLWKKGLSDIEISTKLLQLNPHLNHYSNSDQVGFLKMYYEGFLNRFEGPLAGLSMRVSNNQVLAKMFNKDWQITFNFNDFEDHVASYIPDYIKKWDLLRRNQYLEMKTLLPGYLLSAQGDRMAMGNSIEGRFPFMDHNLIEWVLALPESSKLNDFRAKHLLKEAFKNQIPNTIINRPKQPYMAPDLSAFFPDGKRGILVDQFLKSDIIEQYGIFDPRMIERFVFKIERRGLASSGYRDNMLISFILSAQIIEHQIRKREKKSLDRTKQTVRIIEKR